MRVIAVFGPTASGKSAAALQLAERVGGEIVCCDSMQMYAGLPILTNQPPAEDLARVYHHLVGVWRPDHEGSVAEYGRLAHAAIDDVLARGRTPIVSGGTGLYLRAALADLPLPPRPAPGSRQRYQRLYDRLGAQAAHAALADRDPRAAATVHPNDRRRVVRALELHEAGTTLAPEPGTLWSPQTRQPTAIFGLDVPADVIGRRIERRTEEMFRRGVVDEVAAALAGHRFSHTAARIHGLQDVRALLRGEIGRDEAIRRLIVRTKQYARRQRTWMRRVPGLMPVTDAEQMLAAV